MSDREGTINLQIETKIAIVFLVGSITFMIALTSYNDSDDVQTIAEVFKQKIPECNEFQYYSEFYEECKMNRISIWKTMEGNHTRVQDKEIIGRIVQIETGDHITLESGEKYPISNGIDNIWIDDLVKLQQIRFEGMENCVIKKMQFNNNTVVFADNYNFNPNWNYSSSKIIPQKELQKSASKYFVEYNDYIFENLTNLGQVPAIYEDCDKDSIWEIEKIE